MAFWGKTKTGGKAGFDKLYSWVDKLGPPVNKLSNKLGSEAFWPTSMDKECDKAARILKSFCTDGFYAEDQVLTATGPKQKQKVLKKIPQEVIQNAQGLAIFTTMRSGLWLSGSGGSGVLVARKADGSWSSPSGIQVQTVGLGFLIGVDIYDCVLVINNLKALEAFTRLRATVGGDLSVTAGPCGIGGVLDTELHARQAPIFTYLKSRGFYAGVQIDGTVVIERTDENERFYGEKIRAQDILKGKARHPPLECRGLYETLKAAEGDSDFDPALLPQTPPPSDFEIVQDGQIFGVPSKDDPDPYGVLQLEKEGLQIREAGTQQRASWQDFTFTPSITSPVFETFERRSNRDSGSQILSRRGSYNINTSVTGEARTNDTPRTPVSMINMSTQTDDLPPPPSPARSSSHSVKRGSRPSMDHIPEHEVAPSSPSNLSRSGSWSARNDSRSSRSLTPPPTSATTRSGDMLATSGDKRYESEHEHDTDDDDEEDDAIIVEAPAVHTVQKAVAPKLIQRPRMVDVPRRGPPPLLPVRNPNRKSGPLVINGDRPSSRASLTSTTSNNTQGYDSVLPSPSVVVQDMSMDGASDEPGLDETPSQDVPVETSSDETMSSLTDDATKNDSVLQDTAKEDATAGTPDATPDSEPALAWDDVLAKRASGGGSSRQSLEAPGAFRTVPTTPE